MRYSLGLLAVAGLGSGCWGLAGFNEHSPKPSPEEGVEQPARPETPVGESGALAPALEARCAADGVVRRSISLQAQRDIDALEGCVRVAGDVTLQLFAGVDLRPLLSLRAIEGGLALYGTGQPGVQPLDGVRSPDGLRQLETVGRLFLYQVDLPDLKLFEGLRVIGPDLSRPAEFDVSRSIVGPGFAITESRGLRSLEGLASLEQIDVLRLNANVDLVSLAGMPRLQQLGELNSVDCPLIDLGGVGRAVQVLTLVGTQLTRLENLGDAPQLRRLTTYHNLALTSLEGGSVPAEMELVSTADAGLVQLKGLENLRSVGALTVSYDGVLPSSLESLEGLEGLQQVGTLLLHGVTRLASLGALGALRSVEDFGIRGAQALTTLAGLESLRTADTFSLDASNLMALTGLGAVTMNSLNLSSLPIASLAGLEQITTGELTISAVPNLATLRGLAPLTTLRYLDIRAAPLLEDVQALSSLNELDYLGLGGTGLRDLDALASLRVLRSLFLLANPELVQIDAVADVTALGSLQVVDNPALRTLPRFENATGPDCSDCGSFSLSVQNNALLETGPSLPLLERAGSLDVAYNPTLTSLSGFSALRFVDSISILSNASLMRVEFPRVEEARDIYIRDNVALDDTPLAPLEQLRSERSKIVGNASAPRQLSPCPWLGDGECDERSGDCAAGSDRIDCGYAR